MNKKARLSWALALTAGLVWANSVSAQYRVNNNDGRIRDANNRLGSNGSNGGVPPPQLPNGNLLITGNVTGGAQFQGFVPYQNPMSFHGPTASEISDNFIRSSTGAPFGGINRDNSNVVQPFYGSSSTVGTPPGFTQLGGGGGFVPAKPQTTRAPGDLRLGQVLNNPTVSNVLPHPGQLVLPGPVDPTSQTSSIITASPLYGVRQLNPGLNAQDQAVLNSLGGGTLSGTQMDPAMINQLRQQLLQNSAAPLPNSQNDQQGQDSINNTNGLNTQRLNSTLQKPFESPQSSSLTDIAGIQSNQLGVTDSTGSNNLATGEGTQQRLIAPQRLQIQSAQYTELQKRLSQYKALQPLNNSLASKEYNDQLRQKQEAAGAQAPGAAQGGGPRMPLPGTPGGTPGITTLPPGMTPLPQPAIGTTPPPQPEPITGAPGPIVAPPTDATGTTNLNPAESGRPAPLKIKSLADGVQVKALADMLKDAEDLTRTGKYNSALEQYDMADQVAPNNPLVLLGRANVELGRTYYARAEQNLRQAFTQDQALLMGQYDLQSLLGQDRLQAVVTDLKAVSEREQKEPRSVFLLAYIAYNTGNERRAAAYLDLAEKRAGGKDPLYALIRKHWALPQDTAPVNINELNK